MSVSLKDKIVQHLRDEVIFGRLMPGQQLKEVLLSEKFKCSRGPVREALNQLKNEGFIIHIPNQGAVVTQISPKEVEDYYALLELLEGKAVKWATPLMKPEDINRLEKINYKIRQISPNSRNSIEKWIPLNLAFHRFFRVKCENTKLDWLIEQVRMRITRFLYSSLLVSSFSQYVKDHYEIIDAVREGNARKAEKLMQKHIHHAKEVLMTFLTTSG